MEAQIGKLIFNPENPQETMIIVAPESWDILPDGDWFVAQYEYTGMRMYCKLTGRTRQKWDKACPTVERYYIDTVVRENADGRSALFGVVDRRYPRTWATRPENVRG